MYKHQEQTLRETADIMGDDEMSRRFITHSYSGGDIDKGTGSTDLEDVGTQELIFRSIPVNQTAL